MKSRGAAPRVCVCVCVLVVNVHTSTDARLRVLSIMEQCQASPRPELKENGPAYGTPHWYTTPYHLMVPFA